LNEAEKDSAVKVFKPWNERLDTTKFLESGEDEELIIHIPFTGAIKLKSIIISGGDQGSSPKQMKIFTNREDIDFSNANEVKPVQEWDLHEDFKAQFEYPTRIAKFNNVSNITIYIPNNFGAENTRIYYIGLKGDFTMLNRGPVIATYEAKPLVKDHKVPDETGMSRNIQ